MRCGPGTQGADRRLVEQGRPFRERPQDCRSQEPVFLELGADREESVPVRLYANVNYL